MENYERLIQNAIKNISSHAPDDYTVVSKYLLYKSRYEEAVAEGGKMYVPVAMLYIRKEAYRRIAHARGYTNEAMSAGGR